MGRLLLKDFNDQKKNIVGILLLAVLGAAVGFAFRMIYDCVGLILTAGMTIVYINCFFEYHTADANAKNDDDDKLIKILREKLKVRTKYVEIICLAAVSYIVMSIAYLSDAFDTGQIYDPDYSIFEFLEQIAIYPLVFMLSAAIITPILITKIIGKVSFVILAFCSILIPYGVFLLDFLMNFTEMKQLMVSLPIIVLGLTMISYFISMSVAIRKK